MRAPPVATATDNTYRLPIMKSLRQVEVTALSIRWWWSTEVDHR